MRKLVFGAMLLALAPSAIAATGYLVKSEFVSTITGKTAWKCTYNVWGRYVTVMLKDNCPSSMEFD